MGTTGRGWGMWCGSWMDVDGEYGVVLVWGYMGNGGWTYSRIENGGNLKLKQI